MLKNANIDSSCNTIIVTDCDKTLSIEDTTNIACDIKSVDKEVFKEIYSGDRYSNYQAWLANRYIVDNNIFDEEIIQEVAGKTHFNNAVIVDLQSKKSVQILALSAGFAKSWEAILRKGNIPAQVLTSNNGIVSKYVKYFVVKLLKKQGKFIVAIGDSLLDGLMLKEANVGYIATTKGHRKNVEEFLRNNQAIRQLKYFDYQYDFLTSDEFILSAKSLIGNEEINQKIALCKSNSNCTGKDLRVAHYSLGREVAKMIKSDSQKDNFAVIILMRSGLPFGLGIADLFDCPTIFYGGDSHNLSKQLQENNLLDKQLILCDGVVNTGKSIYTLIGECKLKNVIIATNVLSDKVDKTKMIPIYATRISQNSFVGTKQKTVVKGKGPDTSDRLFNLINW
jgi:soluble P-type ATPase